MKRLRIGLILTALCGASLFGGAVSHGPRDLGTVELREWSVKNQVKASRPSEDGLKQALIASTAKAIELEIRGNEERLKPGRKYELTVYLVYKREYFALIPDYYVHIVDVK